MRTPTTTSLSSISDHSFSCKNQHGSCSSCTCGVLTICDGDYVEKNDLKLSLLSSQSAFFLSLTPAALFLLHVTGLLHRILHLTGSTPHISIIFPSSSTKQSGPLLAVGTILLQFSISFQIPISFLSHSLIYFDDAPTTLLRYAETLAIIIIL